MPLHIHNKLLVHCCYKSILSNPKARDWTIRLLSSEMVCVVWWLSCIHKRKRDRERKIRKTQAGTNFDLSSFLFECTWLRIDHFIKINTKFHYLVNQKSLFLMIKLPKFQNWAKINLNFIPKQKSESKTTLNRTYIHSRSTSQVN